MPSSDRIPSGVGYPRSYQSPPGLATHLVYRLRQPSRLRGRLIFATVALTFYICALLTKGHQAALRRYVAASLENPYFTIPYSESLRWKDDDEVAQKNGPVDVSNMPKESWEQIMTDQDIETTSKILEEGSKKIDAQEDLDPVGTTGEQTPIVVGEIAGKEPVSVEASTIAEAEKQVDVSKNFQEEKHIEEQKSTEEGQKFHDVKKTEEIPIPEQKPVEENPLAPLKPVEDTKKIMGGMTLNEDPPKFDDMKKTSEPEMPTSTLQASDLTPSQDKAENDTAIADDEKKHEILKLPEDKKQAEDVKGTSDTKAKPAEEKSVVGDSADGNNKNENENDNAAMEDLMAAREKLMKEKEAAAEQLEMIEDGLKFAGQEESSRNKIAAIEKELKADVVWEEVSRFRVAD